MHKQKLKSFLPRNKVKYEEFYNESMRFSINRTAMETNYVLV